MAKYVFLLLPIIISFLAYIQSLKKDNLNLIAELTKEISSKRPNPYIVESLVSKIHFMRPIPYKDLIVILRKNNSYEILVHLSRCRRFLKLVTPVILNRNITFEYTPPFSTKLRRFFSLLLCAAVAGFCFTETLKLTESLFDNYQMIEIYEQAKSYKLNPERFDIAKNVIKALATFILYFTFSMQFITISASMWRVKVINKLV